jgi:hypothetical protein
MVVLQADSNPDLATKLATEGLLSKSGSRPIYLSSIEVNGGETFSTEFFNKLLRPLMSNGDYTLHQLIAAVESSRENLAKTNVFNRVNARLHSDFTAVIPSSIKNYNKERSIATKVIFDLSSVKLNIGEGFLNFNNEESVNIDLNYLNNNFNNNAELVNFGVNYNPYKPNDHLYTNGRFLASLNNPSFKFLFDVFHSHQNNEVWQQSSEGSTGGIIGVQYNKSKDLNILTGLSLVKRTIHNIDDAADDQLRFYAGDFLKSSIIHQVSYARDVKYLNHLTKNFVTDGNRVNISSEIASNQEQDNIDNSSVFFKSTVSLNSFKSFFNNYITSHLSADFGGIYTTNEKSSVHVSDKFYLGGINSFRGFSKNGVHENGGLQFYKLSGTIYSKVPSFLYAPLAPTHTNDVAYEANPLRLYTQGTIGNVSNNLLQELSIPASVGFGIRYFNHWANFDVGYFVSKRLGDDNNIFGIKDGLQFSVSIGGTNRLT